MSDEGETKAWIAERQVDLARVCGVSLATVQSWAKQGMPGEPGTYDLSQIIPWLRTEGPWKQHAKSENEEERRYRTAKANTAELEFEQARGELLDRGKVRSTLVRWAAIIRQMGDRLGKRFGLEASTAVNDALLECEIVVDHEFGAGNSADEDAA